VSTHPPDANVPGHRPSRNSKINVLVVANLVDQLLDAGQEPTGEEVSHRLNIEPRSLQRRLQAAGTNLTRVVDQRRLRRSSGANENGAGAPRPERDPLGGRGEDFVLRIFERKGRPGRYRAVVNDGRGQNGRRLRVLVDGRSRSEVRHQLAAALRLGLRTTRGSDAKRR